MIKILKWLTAIIILICISVATYFQIKAEDYFDRQTKTYGIFKNNKRDNYKPFLIFIIESNVLNKHQIYWKTMDEPFQKVGLYEGYVVVPMYSAYMNYCYSNSSPSSK